MERIRNSFERQGLMKTLNAKLHAVEEGQVTLTCDFSEAITQQQGFIHGGTLASLADVACGYAALSIVEGSQEVLTVEFKVNFLKPAKTNRLIVVGQVLQSGRRLCVCEGTVYDEHQEKVIAKMMATMIIVKAQ